MEISENSENHLKAIVGGRQVAGKVWVRARDEKEAGKTWGEEKALENGLDAGTWSGASANYIDLRARSAMLVTDAVFPAGIQD